MRHDHCVNAAYLLVSRRGRVGRSIYLLGEAGPLNTLLRGSVMAYTSKFVGTHLLKAEARTPGFWALISSMLVRLVS